MSSRDRREGEVVIHLFGWRVRFYAGSSYFARPRIHVWNGYGTRGIALRRSRYTPGPGGQRVFGVQWRRDVAS